MIEQIESYVIDYFELNGFLVRRGLGDFPVVAQKCYPSLIVRNLKEESLDEFEPSGFQWFSSDVMKASRVVVSVIGTELLELGKRAISSDKKIQQVVQKKLNAKQAQLFPWAVDEFQQTLDKHWHLAVIPVLPLSEPHRTDLLEHLKVFGVEGVITVRTILDNLVQKLENPTDLQNSPSLKSLLILKQLDLLKIRQMDLFSGE